MIRLKRLIYIFVFGLFIVFIYKCPFLLIFRFPCPGCGLSRAMLSFIYGDISEAIRYHPLFPLVIFDFCYLIIRPKHKFPVWIEVLLLIISVLLFILVYIYRIINNQLV